MASGPKALEELTRIDLCTLHTHTYNYTLFRYIYLFSISFMLVFIFKLGDEISTTPPPPDLLFCIISECASSANIMYARNLSPLPPLPHAYAVPPRPLASSAFLFVFFSLLIYCWPNISV